MLKRYLLAPGPTPVPPEVLLAMARPMIHHRAPEFDPIFAEVREGLKWLFQTRNDVLMLASSGTGAVSYTHLDVYKRQSSGSGARSPSMLNSPSVTMSIGRPGGVRLKRDSR